MNLRLKRFAAGSMRLLLCIASALFAGQLPSGVAWDLAAAGRSGKPNIILFLVDDLGWQDSSVAFGNRKTVFQDHFRTPHVRRLAAQGVRFVNAYAHCVCSPTRTSILTGLNPTRHHVTNWTLLANRDPSGSTSRLLAPAQWRTEGLQPDDTTLARRLKSAGYTTIHCGKAHWGAYDTPGSDPCNLGFDVNIAGHAAGGPGSYQGSENYGNHPDGTHRRPWGVPGLEQYHGTETHLTDALAAEACEAISNAAAEGPFFLYMAPYAVHAPLQPHGRFIHHYRHQSYPLTNLAIPEAEARYASMVEGYDAALGAILDQVEKLGLSENTIVIFTSDNGGLTVHARGTTPRGTGANTHCWPLREGKGSAYEGGTRVPMIISWARAADDDPDPTSVEQQRIPIKPGSRSKAHVICEDLMPTICQWGGVSVDDLTLDGRAISSATIREIPAAGGDRPLLFHYPHVWGPRGPGYQPHSSLRKGPWKIIYFYHAQRWELYDLAQDPGETRNLSHTHPDRLAQMARLLIQQLTDHDAQYPIDRASGKPAPPQYREPSVTTNPVISREDRAAAAGWKGGGNWLDQHRDINRIAATRPIDLVFLGDSITQSWGGSNRNVGSVGGQTWQSFYADRNAGNFGISGDRTQHVLWRIQNGNLDGIHPRLVVLMIGTNNLADDSPENIARGIESIVKQIEERRDVTKILLLGILPRGATATDPLRKKLVQVNRLISHLADGRRCFFLDVGPALLDEQGELVRQYYGSDHLHLTPAGYRAWAQAMEPHIAFLLKETDIKPAFTNPIR